MKSNLTRNKIALHVCLALAAGALTVGCAGNGAKKTQTVEVQKSAAEINTTDLTAIESNPVVKNQMDESQPVENTLTTDSSATEDVTYPDVELTENSKPQQLNFQFGFDKAELSEKDKEIISQHARFLVDNPDMILKIQGHTDHHGPKVYNEYLSKKRAESVAKILIEEGVQESQLEIVALADDAPLADADDTRLNRRVELNYIEMNLVSNK